MFLIIPNAISDRGVNGGVAGGFGVAATAGGFGAAAIAPKVVGDPPEFSSDNREASVGVGVDGVRVGLTAR